MKGIHEILKQIDPEYWEYFELYMSEHRSDALEHLSLDGKLCKDEYELICGAVENWMVLRDHAIQLLSQLAETYSTEDDVWTAGEWKSGGANYVGIYDSGTWSEFSDDGWGVNSLNEGDFYARADVVAWELHWPTNVYIAFRSRKQPRRKPITTKTTLDELIK